MANGPNSPSHLTTQYQSTSKAKGAQTPPDCGGPSSLKLCDAHDRPNYGNTQGGTDARGAGGTTVGQAGGGFKVSLANKYKR